MKKRLISVLGAVIVSCSILWATENEPKKKEVNYGKVSYYGGKFHGRKTASGKIYNKNGLTAAVPLINGRKPSLPFGTKVRITNEKNGKSVIVIINDTGGFAKYGRAFDLSEGAMKQLGGIKSGVLNVSYVIINPLDKYQETDTIYDAPRKPKYIYLAEETKGDKNEQL